MNFQPQKKEKNYDAMYGFIMQLHNIDVGIERSIYRIYLKEKLLYAPEGKNKIENNVKHNKWTNFLLFYLERCA